MYVTVSSPLIPKRLYQFITDLFTRPRPTCTKKQPRTHREVDLDDGLRGIDEQREHAWNGGLGRLAWIPSCTNKLP